MVKLSTDTAQSLIKQVVNVFYIKKDGITAIFISELYQNLLFLHFPAPAIAIFFILDKSHELKYNSQFDTASDIVKYRHLTKTLLII